MTLLGFIFNQLPDYFKESDTYKDGSDRGLLERLVRALEQDFDDNLIPYIENFTTNLNPLTADPKFINYLAYVLGDPPDIFTGSDMIDYVDPRYAKLLGYIIHIYKIKGTVNSYKYLFGFLGLGVNIIELQNDDFLYDVMIYDEDTNVYDEECIECTQYDLIYYNLEDDDWAPGNTHFNPVDPTILAQIDKIICLVEPINAKLRNKLRGFRIRDTWTPTVTQSIVIEKWQLNTYEDSGVIYDDIYNYEDGILLSTLTI